MQMMVANFPFLVPFVTIIGASRPGNFGNEGVKIHNSSFVKDPNLNYVQTILETPKVEIFEISGGDELNIPNFFIDSWTQNPGSHVRFFEASMCTSQFGKQLWFNLQNPDQFWSFKWNF